MSQLNDLNEPTKAELKRLRDALLDYTEAKNKHQDRLGELVRLVDAVLAPTMVTGFLQGLDAAIAEAK